MSGQTHVLNPLGALVLEALSAQPLDSKQLLALLEEPQSGADKATLDLHLTQHLRQLEELGLIEADTGA